jgi:chemotaxis protein CheZ
MEAIGAPPNGLHLLNPLAAAETPEVFQETGFTSRGFCTTRMQHSWAYMPKLQIATVADLPDARSRLSYIAQQDRRGGRQGAEPRWTRPRPSTSGLMQRGAPARSASTGAAATHREAGGQRRGAELREGRGGACAARIDGQLTDIMMAQDFHDLTGQVVAKVVGAGATSWKTAWCSCWCSVGAAPIKRREGRRPAHR